MEIQEGMAMAHVSGERIITSIDVGTTKICVFIARQLDENAVDIMGIGMVPSDGLSKGVVVDIPRAIHSISTAIKEAELMAGIKIESAYIGISGAHIHSLNSQGIVPIAKGVITAQEIMHVLAAAQAIPIPEGQQIIHVLPQYFIIDGRDKVLDPISMHGIRLEVQAHIVLGSVASVQNLVTCCERAGIHVLDIILEQLASADAVLSADECQLGVGVLDIGGGTSDFAVYHNGSIRHTRVVPIAGNHFTNDIAIGLRTTLKEAERIKITYGTACTDSMENSNQLFELEQIQGNDKQIIQLSTLLNVIQPRAYELIQFVCQEIKEHKLRPFMSTGLVLTGGGSLLKGLDEIAQEISRMPIRIGIPHVLFDLPETIRSPLYATGYGILIHTLKKQKNTLPHRTTSTFVTKVFDRMKTWMRDFF